MTKKLITICSFILLGILSFQSIAQIQSQIEDEIGQALKAPFRTDNDRQADTYRLPAETLAFFGLKNDMQVMEVLPGRGYYTKILGQVLAQNGKLYLAAGGGRVATELVKWGFNNVEILDDNFETERRNNDRQYSIINDFSFDARDLDMVLTFRNTHNFHAHDRIKFNQEVFKTLKSGGIYGVVGHTRRHMEPYSRERWRRIDPVALIKEMQNIGFVFKNYSDLHYRSHDPLETDTTTPELNRDSDRFTLIFIKP